MDYNIKSGDNLWNIAKNQYNLTSNKDIANKVKEIAQENNIKDTSSIFAGTTLSLSGLDNSKTSQTSAKKESVTNASLFNDWGNDQNNFNAYMDGNSVKEFTMFDYDSLGATPQERGEAYQTKIQEFSQEYINQFDSNNDGEIDFEEFKKIEYGDNPEDPDMEATLKKKFMELSTLSGSDSDKKYVGEEGLKELYGEDIDTKEYLEKYDKDGNGKIDFEESKDIDYIGMKSPWTENTFNNTAEHDVSAQTIDAKEYSAFFGLLDDSDEGRINGKITYDSYADVMSAYDTSDALKNYYNFFFNGTAQE